MEIKQFFEEFKARRPGSYYQHEQDKRLSKEMTKWGKDDKFLKFLDLVFKQKNRIAANHKKVVGFLSAMGFDDLTELKKMMIFANDGPLDLVGMFNYLFPTLPHKWFTKFIPAAQLTKELNRQTGWTGQNHPALVNYRLVPDDKIPAIVEICNSNEFRYLIRSGGMDGQFSGGRMCRGFTRMVLGWLPQLGLDDLAIGEIKAERFFKGKSTFGHDFLFILGESRKLWYWDGIDDKFFLAADPPGFNMCDKLNVFFWNV
jgi:hypothetical protein